MSYRTHLTDEYGELYRVIRSVYDTSQADARTLIGDLTPDALYGVLACAQAEQHALYGIAYDQMHGTQLFADLPTSN